MALAAVFLIGMGKAGIKGMDMFNVTLMAIVFGSKTSTGVVLPLLSLADIAAVTYYNRHAEWKYFWKLAPWMMIGILLGVVAGKDMHEMVFRKVMAGIILITIIIVLIMEWRKDAPVPNHPAFANRYFLAMRVGKNVFIGTGAWVFLFMNLFKLPFQVFYWGNISAQTLEMDLYLIPALVIGFVLGIRVVRQLDDAVYRKLVIVLTLLGALTMLFRN